MSNENENAGQPISEEKKRATRANQRVSAGTGARKKNYTLWIILGIGFVIAGAVLAFMFLK